MTRTAQQDFENTSNGPLADEIDRACQVEEMQRVAALEAAARYKPPTPKDPGFCDFCEEPTLSPTILFCCAGCRDDDAAEKRRLALRGRQPH